MGCVLCYIVGDYVQGDLLGMVGQVWVGRDVAKGVLKIFDGF